MTLQERSTLFIGAGIEVYEGMVVGENSRSEDMDVNPTRRRSSPTCARRLPTTRSGSPPRPITLEQALEFIADDECVEVTPDTVRLRKIVLDRASAAASAATPSAEPRAVRREVHPSGTRNRPLAWST